ncbi:5'(3')-deoxyribonucleotidase [Aureisphaera galaxeae]|uniref:5' nucleotidase, NT5C type n=1 Tax=Aureisphaera galaxeae TaxID=1538023 RepID=UPI00234FE320|nr:5'(3')-deoxyribonucleotidase [Aureisphaera galaxeae]MDC8004105.1 5'(3')-deoxyribonucleotidase [Aureisphaera galaxeae]
MKQRLLIDMDGVMADIYQQAINFEFAESGRLIQLEEVNGKDEIVAFPNAKRHVREKGFFREAPVIPDAQEVVKALYDSYDIFIVSAAMEFPNSLEEKYYWLEEHFPFISWRNIILCGSKVPVQGDILIDDHYKNLDPFKNRSLLFTQPHNINDDRGHERVNNWKEIAELLL